MQKISLREYNLISIKETYQQLYVKINILNLVLINIFHSYKI